MSSQMNDAEDPPSGRSVGIWIISHWVIIVLVLAATLLANGALILANGVATTCSDYVPEVSGAPIDVMAGFHQCHHWVGLEIPTQWNPFVGFGFGLLAGWLGSLLENHEPPRGAAGRVSRP